MAPNAVLSRQSVGAPQTRLSPAPDAHPVFSPGVRRGAGASPVRRPQVMMAGSFLWSPPGPKAKATERGNLVQVASTFDPSVVEPDHGGWPVPVADGALGRAWKTTNFRNTRARRVQLL